MDDELTAMISVEFDGVEEAATYAKTLREVAAAERDVARAMKARKEAQASGASAMPDLSKIVSMIPQGYSPAFSSGSGGTSGRSPRSLPTIQEGLEKMLPEGFFSRGGGTRTAASPMERALRSTRIGNGKVAPLAGQAAEALLGKGAAGMAFGAAAKLAGPIGIAITALEVVKKAGEEMFKLADGASKASLALHDIRAVSGGSTADAARLQGMSFLGASAENAAAFKERISSDPNAMMEAGKLGIRNVKGNFGNQNWTAQYLKAIEDTAKISDETERLYKARTLGIAPEVERLALLSPATREAMRQSQAMTAKVNDPEAQKAAAEFAAAVDLESKARENMMNAIGQFFGKRITEFLNSAAALENSIAGSLKGDMESMKSLLPNFLDLASQGDAQYTVKSAWRRGKEALGMGGGSETATDPNAAITANTRATLASVQAMDRLNGSLVGAGQRGSGFFGGMRDTGGAGYHEAVTNRSLAWGTLG
jgi:hypothetical protein